jgi:hypothetical protein
VNLNILPFSALLGHATIQIYTRLDNCHPTKLNGRLLRAASRVTRPIDRALHVPGNTILARIELSTNYAVLAERATDGLADLANGAVRVELLADGAGGGDDGGVLRRALVSSVS